MSSGQLQANLAGLFRAGGIFMWPILVLSVCAVALVLERIVTITLFHVKTSRLTKFLASGGTTGRSEFSTIGTAVFDIAPDEAERRIEEAVQTAFDRMGRNNELLAGIGNVAPLLGFIGTVSGMISSFSSIAQADRVSVKLVAGGIAEALITTGFGLIVAVICISAEHLVRYYLSSRAHSIEEEAGEFIEGRRNDEAQASE